MKRMIMMVALAAFLVAALSVSAVSAFADPVPEECHKERGTVVCPSVAKNDRFTGNQETTKKGSLQSSHEEETQCVETPCPPGQFK
jgi:hypothetical protein